jgi:hypothetical protein
MRLVDKFVENNLHFGSGQVTGGSMSLKITNSEVDGASVVELDGRIVLGEESNLLRKKLKSLVAGERKKSS